MPGIDESLPFKPVRIAVLTVSDTRTLDEDTSGATLQDRLEKAGHTLADRALVRDDKAAIRAQISNWVADDNVDAIITTGGTGLTGRDVTVEAIKPLFDKEIDGFSVIFHQISMTTVGTSTLQSRACAGLAQDTFIFCLPGSTGAVKDGWDGILQHQLDSRHKPCNFVELMPRLLEK
ncbi:MAG: molybdenum cofactor biosynthesis protein B [Alphaproteobacteria bacterium]